MKSRRQLLELVGIAIVGVACAPAAPAPATTAPAASTPAVSAAKPTTGATAAPVVAGGVTLKVAHVTTGQQVWDDAWNGIWSSFESKNPGIKLEVENLPFWPRRLCAGG